MWLAELGKELGFYSNLSRMSEFFTLANTLYQSFGKYDHFIIDNEPSAGTLDMIDSIDGWIDGLDNVKKYKLIFNMILKAGIKDKQLVQQTKEIMYGQNGAIVEEYKQMLASIKQLFTSPKYLESIIVSSPEDTVIRETHRLRKELEDRVGIQNKYVIFNKVSITSNNGKIQKEKIRSFGKETRTECFSVPQLSISEINLHGESGAIDMLHSLYAGLKKCSL